MPPRLILIALLVCFLWGCADAGTQRFTGRQTKPASRVAVDSGGPHQAHWQTRDLTLNFEYQWEANSFDIAGTVDLASKIQNFTTIEHLRIRIHFLDAEGVILTTYNVWNAGNRESMHYHFVNFKFNKDYPPPPDTAMIGFSYTGEASDAGGDGLARRSGGRGDWSFWWQP